jgi:penicillin-binding protein 1C
MAPYPALRRAWRLVRALLLIKAGFLAAFTSALLIAVYAVPYPVDELDPGRGGPLVITDREGNVLRSVPGAQFRPGRESWVVLSDVPAAVIVTVVASEDEGFYRHGGVDGKGVARALWLDVKKGRVAYGGSTITMQLVRMMRSAGQRRSLSNKLKEAVLAMRLERAMEKRDILEQYLNRAYYGNGAYGIEAAARLYFDRPAAALSLGQATFLAIIPRAPSAYDPIERLGVALRRRDYVLDLLVKRGLLSAPTVDRAQAQPISVALHKPPFLAPHFTDWVLDTLPAEVRARGGVVRTTLDLDLQASLEHRTRDHVEGMRRRNMHQAGMVVLDTQRGEILAMIGSADYHGDQGQVNIVTRRRHPGSALKPFVYGLAIESGDHPASIAYDVYSDNPGYQVVNKSQPERGPVRYREALAGSYNLAAVDVLDRVGVPRLMSLLREAGVGALDGDPAGYGLRLALGSAKVRLLDLAAAYGFLVRGGRVRQPVAVIEAVADDGRIFRPRPAAERRILSPETSWMVMDMLADPEARRAVFGQELPLDLPYRVAAKTGTARGFADTVAIAVTSELTVAAWAGNFDGKPTEGLVAMRSAAPLVRAGLLLSSRGRDLTLPERPRGVEARYVCALSGMAPSPDCPHHKRDYFRRDRGDAGPACDWHRREDGRLVIEYPGELSSWARRHRHRGGRHL